VLLEQQVSLAPLTTLHLGGPARRLLTVSSPRELVEAVADADAAAEPLLVLGGGSNVVVPDEGFAGTVVLIRTSEASTLRDGSGVVRLFVQAGAPWDGVVAHTVSEGLSGLECLSGIPGSTGATPIQNVGAYGQEVAETITAVGAYDRAERQVVRLTPPDLRFTYRHSMLKGVDRYVVLDVTFALIPERLSRPIRYAELAQALGTEIGARVPLDDARAAVLSLRRRKGMVIDPGDPDTASVGSFFTNPVLGVGDFDALAARAKATPPHWPMADGQVKASAAWLIERAGFAKGYGNGQVGISTKHTLALTNRGGGTTAQLLSLAREIRDGVRTAYGVELTPEPVLLGAEL